MTRITRPMRSTEETLDMMGVPRRARERWMRELAVCTTREQVDLTARCHQLEAYIFGRWGR